MRKDIYALKKEQKNSQGFVALMVNDYIYRKAGVSAYLAVG